MNEKAPEFADKSVEEVDATHFCSLGPAGKNVRYSASFGNFAGYKVWIQLIIKSLVDGEDSGLSEVIDLSIRNVTDGSFCD